MHDYGSCFDCSSIVHLNVQSTGHDIIANSLKLLKQICEYVNNYSIKRFKSNRVYTEILHQEKEKSNMRTKNFNTDFTDV